jgi:hypothetical protein
MIFLIASAARLISKNIKPKQDLDAVTSEALGKLLYDAGECPFSYPSSQRVNGLCWKAIPLRVS